MSNAADNKTPFQRFADLTRRVLSVPKAEADKLRENRNGHTPKKAKPPRKTKKRKP